MAYLGSLDGGRDGAGLLLLLDRGGARVASNILSLLGLDRTKSGVSGERVPSQVSAGWVWAEVTYLEDLEQLAQLLHDRTQDWLGSDRLLLVCVERVSLGLVSLNTLLQTGGEKDTSSAVSHNSHHRSVVTHELLVCSPDPLCSSLNS